MWGDLGWLWYIHFMINRAYLVVYIYIYMYELTGVVVRCILRDVARWNLKEIK